VYEAVSRTVAEQAEGLPSAAGAATPADDPDRQTALPQAGHTSAYDSIAYVSIRQHSIRQLMIQIGKRHYRKQVFPLFVVPSFKQLNPDSFRSVDVKRFS
jgi:hypothetical protein